MRAPPRPLRAHMALCLLGFEGKGYSAAFVAEMQALSDALAADPDLPLELVAEPDGLCAACPNLADAGCTLGGPDHEAHMRSQDEDVLARLGLPVGAQLSWRELLARIRAAVAPGDLPDICTTCPWLPLGVCAAGLARLRDEAGPGA